MSSVRQYWEKYRERKKSPSGTDIFEGLLNNCKNDRISDLQGQINILEERVANLSRQVKLQEKNEVSEIFETVEKIHKIDNSIELQDMFSGRIQELELKLKSFKCNCGEKLEKMLEKHEKKITSLIDDKFEELSSRIKKAEEKCTKRHIKKAELQKLEENLMKKIENSQTKSRKASRSGSNDNLRRKIEEFSVTQEKLQKIVINTAEKVKNHKKIPDTESQKFSSAIEKISDLLKKYSLSQSKIYESVRSLEEKARVLEERFEKSFAASEPVDIHRQNSSQSIDENFQISFGSEDNQIIIPNILARDS